MKLDIHEIKKEGAAGLNYAYDVKGIYTPATKAITGDKYTCPICGIPMHVTTTKSGNRIFAKNPGQTHLNAACITIERQKHRHSFENLDPEKFIRSLCHVTPRKRVIEKKETSDENSESTTPTTSLEYDSNLLTFSSLKQIAESGIDYLKPDDMQGSHKISEFIITYKYGKNFFKDPSFSLGARIVYAKYLFPEKDNLAILFSMFEKHEFSVRFRLLFSDRKAFRSCREKFGTFKEVTTGCTKFVPHYQDQKVLIACDCWTLIDKSRCKDFCSPKEDYCARCCGLYQALYTSTKQLYLIPADH